MRRVSSIRIITYNLKKSLVLEASVAGTLIDSLDHCNFPGLNWEINYLKWKQMKYHLLKKENTQVLVVEMRALPGLKYKNVPEGKNGWQWKLGNGYESISEIRSVHVE